MVGGESTALVHFSFAAVCLLSSAGLFLDRRDHSCSQIFYIFQLVFMGTVPWLQLSLGGLPWGIHPSNQAISFANLTTITWIICYAGSYRLWKGHALNISVRPLRITMLGAWALIACNAALLAWITGVHGYEVLFYRDQWESVRRSFGDSSLAQAFVTFSRQFPLLSFLTIWIYGGRHLRREKLIAGLLLLTLCFPAGIQRSQLGQVLIALFVAYTLTHAIRRYTTRIALLLALLGAYPLMGAFRFASSDAPVSLDAALVSQSFQGGDFDAFSMLTLTQDHVEEHGLSWGVQMAGAVLFFVPRRLWPDKPVGSGHMVARQERMAFTNLSCPAQGEAYLNFGLLGVILIAALYGAGLRTIDESLERDSNWTGQGLSPLLYCSVLGLLFLNLRGDMMSSLSFIAMTLTIVVGIRLTFLQLLPLPQPSPTL